MADESVGSVKSGDEGGSDSRSRDSYPEVSGDESGIVPPQTARPPEWPKRIRMLTAAELDRLTIDGSGRFYWDGKLVNYETRPAEAAKPNAVSLEQSLDMLERAANEFSGRSTATTDETPKLARTSDLGQQTDHAAKLAEVLVGPTPPHPAEPFRLKLTGLQSFALALAVIGIALGAFGMAASGLVAAHQWGCRTGMIRSACPVPPPQPQRPDIPA